MFVEESFFPKENTENYCLDVFLGTPFRNVFKKIKNWEPKNIERLYRKKRLYLKNKFLLISINFTPKTSHSCRPKENGTFLGFPGKTWDEFVFFATEVATVGWWNFTVQRLEIPNGSWLGVPGKGLRLNDNENVNHEILIGL